MKSMIVLLLAVMVAGCGPSASSIKWETTGGPTAQNVSALLADEKSPGWILAGLTNGDIYSSPDYGKHWTMLHRSPQRKRIFRLVQHPEDAEKLFAASEGGLFVSTNRGREWSILRVETGSQEQAPCRALAIDPWKTSTLYAGLAGRGLHMSADGGNTWSPAFIGTNARLSISTVTAVVIDPAHPDVIYAAYDGAGIYRSRDAGKTWTGLTSDAGMESPTCILVHHSDNLSVAFGTSNGGFFKSTNGGESWSQTAMVSGGGHVLSMSGVPTNHDQAFAGTENGVMRSSDFGGTWVEVRSTLPSSPTTVMVVQDRSRPFLFAFGSGIGVQMSTDNGGTWSHADANLGGACVSKIVVSADGATVLGSVEGTVFKRTPASGEWIAAGSGLRGGTVTSLCIDEGDPRVMYATTPAGMFRGSLEGGTWEAFARVLPSPPTIVVSHPWYKNRLFAAGDHGIFVSTNSGKSWSQTRPVDLRHTVNGFTFTPTNAGLVHAATDDVGVLQSTNGGIAWEERRYGLTADKIITVTLDDDDPRTLYAWTGKGECYRSTNLGTEWDRYAVPWHEGRQVLVAMEKNKPSSVVALVDGRDIYYSHSGGGTWRLLLQRGPTFRASTILWNEATKTMYLGTADSGVFMIDLGPAFQEEPDQEE